MMNCLRRWRWSGEGDNGETEYKDGFQKHYSAQGTGSDRSRCIEESGMKALVKKRRETSLFLYSGCLGFITTAFSKRMIKRPRSPFH